MQYLFNARTIESFITRCIDCDGITNATANRRLACLKTIFKMAIRWGLLVHNPAERIKTMKEELVTAKILASPCDAEVQGPNEKVQGDWKTYDTLQNKEIPCGAISYRFVDGGSTGRPGTMLAVTRNLSTMDLTTARLVGADEAEEHPKALTGLNKGQGQASFADGSARQVNDPDIKAAAKYHLNSSGGIAKGAAATEVMSCCSGAVQPHFPVEKRWLLFWTRQTCGVCSRKADECPWLKTRKKSIREKWTRTQAGATER